MNDASLQSMGLKFSFIAEKENLIIQAYCLKENSEYVGEIASHPLISFEDIKELLEEGQYKTLIKNENVLKIKVGAIPLELLPKSKSEIKDLQDFLMKSIKKQEELHTIIKDQQIEIDEQKCLINDLKMTINELKETVQCLTHELKLHKTESEGSFNELKSTIRELKLKLNKLENPSDLMPLNLPIESIKWSQELKSKKVKVDGLIVKSTESSKFPEFCLLNVGFSRTLKRKQCWGFGIKKKTSTFYVGLCLKKSMEKMNFNFQNFKWEEPGHGCYLIGSGGYCYNHSMKEFNNVTKSFRFDEGDVIFVEYDPIKECVRFRKNEKGLRFEMPIVLPPEDDSYHPCVDFYNENTEIELILPGINLS